MSFPNKYATVTQNTVCNIYAGNYTKGTASHIQNERQRVLSGTRNVKYNTNISRFQVTLSRAPVIIASKNRNILRKKHQKQDGRTVAYLQGRTEGIHKRIRQDSRYPG